MWSVEATPEDLRRVNQLRVKEKRSLAASVAIVILEDKDRWNNRDAGPFIPPDTSYAYTRIAWALLNTETFIKTDQPLQLPEEDEKLKDRITDVTTEADFKNLIQSISHRRAQRLEKSFIGEDIDTQLEAEITILKVEWYLTEQRLTKFLTTNDDPLAFVEAVFQRESLREDFDEYDKEALEQGRQKFHNVYNAY